MVNILQKIKKRRNNALNSDYINKTSIGTSMAVVQKEGNEKTHQQHRQ
jgi:hypothetical protein